VATGGGKAYLISVRLAGAVPKRLGAQEKGKVVNRSQVFTTIIFVIGSILFAFGAAGIWGVAGFVMALGLVLIFFALAD
jgi:hypothetical protein